MIEIDNLRACRDWIAIGTERPPAAFQQLDLRDVAGFESGSFVGCLFLSCELTPAQAGFLTTMGATVIRDQDGRPFTSHRARLYTPEELFAGFDPDDPAGYEATYDAEVYRHWVESGRHYPPMIDESLARRLHDHSISDALYDELADRLPVAVMGGHTLERSDPHYATVARVSRALTRAGRLMLSGGGPGAMEATHLGAWMANFDDGELDAAIAVLSPRPPGSEPATEYADPDWLHRAFAVRNRWPLDSIDGGARFESIGIPTWMYGHEPPQRLPPRSPSTSPTASARRASWRSPPTAWCSHPAAPERSRRSSRTPPRTITRASVRRPRWCCSASTTGPDIARSGRCSNRWPRAIDTTT